MSSELPRVWNFYSAARLVFGRHAVRHLGRLVKQLDAQRLLIITDAALESAGVLERVQESLVSLQIEVFAEGEAEPSLDTAVKACQLAADYQPDAIVGLGGGSNMDLAKITANVQTHGGPLDAYFGFDNVPGPILPLICIPTTSGTGSEVSHAAVLTDTTNQMKVSTLSNHLRPRLALVDPTLTLSCPAQVTADSGIDALTHAVEACTAMDNDALTFPVDCDAPYDGRHSLGDCLAEKAIRLIGQHLRTAVREPDNLPAREGMALAASLAGLAFSNCAVAVVHALEYPLGGALHCSHGAGNGLLLPFVMRYNLPVREQQLAAIAEWLGGDVAGLDTAARAQLAIGMVERLKRDIGIPERIRDIGGRAEQLPEFARKAYGIDRLMRLNPRLPTEADLLTILQDAF